MNMIRAHDSLTDGPRDVLHLVEMFAAPRRLTIVHFYGANRLFNTGPVPLEGLRIELNEAI